MKNPRTEDGQADPLPRMIRGPKSARRFLRGRTNAASVEMGAKGQGGSQTAPTKAMALSSALRPRSGGAMGLDPCRLFLPLFFFRKPKCVLESASQFGNTGVSRSSHPAKRHLLSRPTALRGVLVFTNRPCFTNCHSGNGYGQNGMGMCFRADECDEIISRYSREERYHSPVGPYA